MPIYEFYCDACNTIFNFFSSRVDTEKIPQCPKCHKALQRQVSMFRTIGKAKEPGENGLPDIDESQMERVLGELASEAENINEDDPKQMAKIMRRFSEKTGLSLGDSMEEALCRLEAGDDPEKIEQEMGNLFEGDDISAMLAQKTAKSGRNRPPVKDEELYEL